MTLADQVGLTGPAYEIDIERGKIREFARAMCAPLPDFVEGRTPVIPATFMVSIPYTWGYTLERPRGTIFETVEHDLTVSLHAEESFEFHGPLLRAGDRLTARPKLETVRQKDGSSGGQLTFLTILTEYHDLDGRLRCEQRSTSVTTGQTPGSSDWQVDLPDYVPDYPHVEKSSPFAAIKRAGWGELQANAGPGVIDAGPLLIQDIVRFQGVVGEDDPLHHDPAWAHQANYPSVFGLGTHQASMMAGYAAHWIAPEAVRSFKVRFRNMVWPGDHLHYDGLVTELDHDSRTANLHLTCKRSDGLLINEAWMACDFSDQERGKDL